MILRPPEYGKQTESNCGGNNLSLSISVAHYTYSALLHKSRSLCEAFDHTAKQRF